MKIKTSTMRKIKIYDIKNLDSIIVLVEDFGPGQGKAIIEIDGDTCSYFWPAMGDQDIITFIIDSHNDYLIKKFTPEISPRIPITNDIKMKKEMKKHILNLRKEGDINKYHARDLWTKVEKSYDTTDDIDLMYEVFGNNWYEDVLPTETNTKYEYMERVMDAVKEGLRLYQNQYLTEA